MRTGNRSCKIGNAERNPRALRALFTAVAARYDFLNHLLSLGLDFGWRRRAVAALRLKGEAPLVLDMACGTADIALAVARRFPRARIVAEDFTSAMLERGAEKIRRQGLRARIFPVLASCEAIPHPDRTFNAAIIAFGIRNVENRPKGLSELVRVLKPGGRLVVLEFSPPIFPGWRLLCRGYCRYVLPLVAGRFSDPQAYRYLARSIEEFPDDARFRELMRAAGCVKIVQKRLFPGLVTLHVGHRPHLFHQGRFSH